MGSIPTKPKHLDAASRSAVSRLRHLQQPGGQPGRGRARPAPAPPAPTAVWGHRDTAHTRARNQLCVLPPRAVPAVTGSDHCCFSPGFLRLGWSVCPGEAISRQRVPPGPSLGAAEPERAAGRGGRRPDSDSSGGSLPENEPGVLGRAQGLAVPRREPARSQRQPAQRSAVGDYFRVTQPELSTSAFIARCPTPSLSRPLAGAPHLRREAAPGLRTPGPELAPAPPSGPPPGARRARSSPAGRDLRLPFSTHFVSQISTAAKINSLLNPPWTRTIQSLLRTSHTPFTCVGRSPPHPPKSREVICATGWWDKTRFLQQRINSCTEPGASDRTDGHLPSFCKAYLQNNEIIIDTTFTFN